MTITTEDADCRIEMEKETLLASEDGVSVIDVNTDTVIKFHLFINPVAIGNGMTIFKDLKGVQKFNLVKSVAFDCGIIGLHYEPKRVL